MNDVMGRLLIVFAVLAAVALPLVVFGNCSLSGAEEVQIDGSSTVYPISQALAEDYSRGRRVQVTVGISGTGGGFERFCRGETDVAAASREIKPNEVEHCAREGITDIVELDVAIDALTVVVSKENEFAQCMTVDELRLAFREGGARRWSDIRPEWPNEPITPYHPGSDSGTFDYFVEAIIESGEGEASHRTDGNASEDDNLIALGVSNDRHGLGYFGFAYYQEAADRVRAVAIDNGDGCVEPTVENVLAGEYEPLSRELYYYTSETYLRERRPLREYIDYAYSHLPDVTEETGYIRLPDDALAREQEKLAQLPFPRDE